MYCFPLLYRVSYIYDMDPSRLAGRGRGKEREREKAEDGQRKVKEYNHGRAVVVVVVVVGGVVVVPSLLCRATCNGR